MVFAAGRGARAAAFDVMVELTGIEPATSGVQNRRSPN
jgi:hypothetical protein